MLWLDPAPLSTKRPPEAQMLEIMLCGAHDVGELSAAFSEVARDFGAEPWFYQQGTIQHINSRTSRWSANSRATVRRVDVCVFVILDRFGDITWNEELEEALNHGKPFVLLALESAWDRYSTLIHRLSDPSAIGSDDDRQMVDLLHRISSEYQLTVTSFSYTTFKEKLRAELAQLFGHGIQLIQRGNQRASLMEIMLGNNKLSHQQQHDAVALATDEYEANKLERKTALRRLAKDGFRDAELVLSACASREQGVQRLAFDLLSELLPTPVDDELVRDVVQIATASDDIGVPRRLISGIARIQPLSLDVVLHAAGTTDEGVRRRAYEAVEEQWDEILEAWGIDRMREFLQVCDGTSPQRAKWTTRLRERQEALG
jgi:hypothetical protein